MSPGKEPEPNRPFRVYRDCNSEDQAMKDKADKSAGPNRHSEVLNGKRPASDARLLRDIFSAETRIKPDRQSGAGEATKGSRFPKPKVHDAHVETKPSHQPGVIQWD